MDPVRAEAPSRNEAFLSIKGRRFAFVIPRCGEEIGGGAETLVTQLAKHLAGVGVAVEILTTCAIDNRSWQDHFPPGPATVHGVPVRRFPVSPRDLEQWVPLQIRISEGMKLTTDEQLAWMEHSVTSEELFAYLAQHGASYDGIFFAPYLFGTTFWGSLIHPDRSYLIPCFHDESYAYLEVIQSMCRQVAGMVFNAEEEHQFARRLYGEIRGGEVGMGFYPHPAEYVQALTPYFSDSFPYLLYVGRKETGKNAHLLVDYFIGAKDSGLIPAECRLVIAGGGSFDDLHRPAARQRVDIIDIDHTSEQEKHRLMRHALLLCQPSRNESFSIVIMESWLVGTPVLVNSFCPVTRDHVVQSGGGLYFANESDFSGAIQLLLKERDTRAALAKAGERYVRSRYSWEAVLGRFAKTWAELEAHLPRSNLHT
jgi:glycosyltransferase involved in cell wall biosynthesis